jgi:hypothetical protein
MAQKCHPNGKQKCPGEYCEIHGGTCIKKKKDGSPYKNKYSEKSDYYSNEKYGLVGTKDDVKTYIKEYKKTKKPTKKGSIKKSPKKSPKKASIKKPVKKASIKLRENLEAKTVAQLKEIVKELKIPDEDIGKSEKSGKPLKAHYIAAIRDFGGRQGKKTSIEIPKEKSLKKASSKASLKASPPKAKRVKSDIDEMTIPQIIAALQEYPEYKHLTKSGIQKLIGGSKKADFYMALVTKLTESQKSLKKGSIKKSAKKLIFVEEIEEKLPKKRSPKKRSPKKSPKKSPEEVIQVREGLKRGKKREVKTKESCIDGKVTRKNFGRYKNCGDNSVCDAETGNCLKKSDKNLKGKFILDVEGKQILGSKEAITNLQKLLGGEIISPQKGSIKSVGKKQSAPERGSIITEEEEAEEDIGGTFAEELLKISSKKKTPSLKKPSLKKGSAKKPSLKKPSIKKPSPKVEVKITDSRSDIQKTFMECLSRID